jgi:hypothetical protein
MLPTTAACLTALVSDRFTSMGELPAPPALGGAA